MYAFTGYGTNEYAGLRQEPQKGIVSIIGTRTVTAFTNFTRGVVALTNFIRTVRI